MACKSLNGHVPDYLTEMFVERSSVMNYTLRNIAGKLALPQPRTNYEKYFCSRILSYSKHSLSCFIRYKTLGCASRFISDKTLLYFCFK